MLAALMMIGSLASSLALAPAAPVLASEQDCANGQVWDDTQQMCVDPTPDGGGQTTDATETPMEEATLTPTPGPGTLSVYKYTCPAGYNLNSQSANPAGDCTTPTDGVQMTYTGQDQSNQTQTTANGGVATFANLTPGTFTLSETPPTGTSATAWICESAMQAPSSGTGTAINGQIAGDEQLSCRFYNVPGNGLTIIVHKYQCPAGYDVSGQDADPRTDCTAQQNGVQFNVVGSTTGYTSQSNTGDSVPGAVCPLTVKGDQGTRTVCASSLDCKPLVESRRILVLHLSDVTNSFIKFTDRDMRRMTATGRLPPSPASQTRAPRAANSSARARVPAPVSSGWANASTGKSLPTGLKPWASMVWGSAPTTT